MKPQDIDTIVRLLREEASEISSKDYARIMMREAATTIVALASKLAAWDEQAHIARSDAGERQAKLESALRDMGAASTDAAEQWTIMAISMQRLLTMTAAAAKAGARRSPPLRADLLRRLCQGAHPSCHHVARTDRGGATHKAAPVRTEIQPECPEHPRDRPSVPEALDASTRSERERVLTLARQMQRDCAGLHSRLVERLRHLVEDIESGAFGK